MTYVLYWNSAHPLLSNSAPDCRLIVGFSEGQFTESNPGCTQVNKLVTLSEDQKEDALHGYALAIDAVDPAGVFLIPAAGDQRPNWRLAEDP